MGKKKKLQEMEGRLSSLEEYVNFLDCSRVKDSEALGRRVDELEVLRVASWKAFEAVRLEFTKRMNSTDNKWSALSTRVGHIEGDAKHGITFDAVLRK